MGKLFRPEAFLNMKKEIVKYIRKLTTEERLLTDAEVRAVAYWELVAFTDEGKG